MKTYIIIDLSKTFSFIITKKKYEDRKLSTNFEIFFSQYSKINCPSKDGTTFTHSLHALAHNRFLNALAPPLI